MSVSFLSLRVRAGGLCVKELCFCRNPQNQTAIDAVHQFAADLAARFNPIVGCTRSWDTTDPTNFKVGTFTAYHVRQRLIRESR